MPVLNIGPKPDFTMFRDAVAVYHQVVVSVRIKGQSEEKRRPLRSLSLFNLARHARQVVDGYTENIVSKPKWEIGAQLKGVIACDNFELSITVSLPADLDETNRNLIFANFIDYF
jgi:hypothetical protein